MSKIDRDLIVKYHRALVLAAGKDMDTLKAKMARVWSDDFLCKLDEGSSPEKVEEKFNEFFNRDIPFAEKVNLEKKDGGYTLDVKGCHICWGNEALRQEGKPTACPVITAGLYCLGKGLKKNARMAGVEKSDVGYCKINYKIE